MEKKIGDKTFWVIGNTYTRMKDRNYEGKATVYHKCKKCGKLVNRRWRQYHWSLDDCINPI